MDRSVAATTDGPDEAAIYMPWGRGDVFARADGDVIEVVIWRTDEVLTRLTIGAADDLADSLLAAVMLAREGKS